MHKLADDITIIIAKEPLVLRPTLRCALQLERRPGGFPQLMREVSEGSLSAACDIVGQHYHREMFFRNRVLDALPTLAPALTAYVMACMGIDLDAKEDDKASAGGKPVPFHEYLEGLFKIGTGWLGWTPEDTLEATPTEITLAYRGRGEFLKAIFGGGGEPKPKKTGPWDENVRSIFAGFETIKETAE